MLIITRRRISDAERQKSSMRIGESSDKLLFLLHKIGYMLIVTECIGVWKGLCSSQDLLLGVFFSGELFCFRICLPGHRRLPAEIKFNQAAQTHHRGQQQAEINALS